jgi:hypothetical protein
MGDAGADIAIKRPVNPSTNRAMGEIYSHFRLLINMQRIGTNGLDFAACRGISGRASHVCFGSLFTLVPPGDSICLCQLGALPD